MTTIVSPIDLGPIVNQIVVPLVTPILVAGFTWIVYRVQSLLHAHILDGHRAVLETAIQNGIKLATSRVPPTLLVSSKNQIVSEALAYVNTVAPQAVAKLGLAKDADALAAAIEARLPAGA